MALSDAERQRRRYAKKKAMLKEAADLTPVRHEAFAALIAKVEGWPVDKRLPDDLSEIAQALSFMDETLASVGFDLPDFAKDHDPEWHDFGGWSAPDRGSLGKAERMVGAFIDCARSLAEIINAFKLREIEAARNGIAERDLSTPEAKREALADGARLDRIERRLRREVRQSFPAIEVKEE